MKQWKALSLIFILLLINIAQSQASRFDVTGSTGSKSVMTVIAPAGNIHLIGHTTHNSLVYIMENSQVIGTELSDENGLFEKFFRGIPVGIHTISIYSVNEDSENTITVNYNINVADATDTVVNIILPPSINIDVDRVKRPAPIIAYGQTVPNYLVRILLTGSKDNTSVETTADSDGKWSVNINPKLHLGSKTAYAISLNGQGGQSEISKAKFFTVVKSADLNNDTLVDLTDFSILMYSYAKRPIRNVLSDINDDDTVDLVDFSIMMSQWSR